MSIGHLGGLLHSWRVKASRRKFDHGNHLFMGQMKPFHDLADRGSYLQIVKNNGNRRPRIPEYPCATTLSGDALHGRAL
jgi:hypothetical protein